jgi:hypothetical protein
MPKAYKITSDPFFVNANITQTVINGYLETEVSLPLDSLNREGILVHAVYFTSSRPERILGAQSVIEMQVTSTTKTGIINANDPNLLGHREVVMAGGAGEFSGPHIVDMITNTDSYQGDMNLGLVATDNLFLGLDSDNQAAVKYCQVRVVCSRIKLEAAAYAALVTNELSS